MHVLIDQLQTIRMRMRDLIQSLPNEARLRIPAGFNNNVLWHATHVVVTQQLLCYKLSGLALYIDDHLVTENRKGTSPKDWQQQPDPERICHLLTELPQRLSDDHAAGRFQQFESYRTSAGVELRNFHEALAFNHFHEGIHFGCMMDLRRVVS